MEWNGMEMERIYIRDIGTLETLITCIHISTCVTIYISTSLQVRKWSLYLPICAENSPISTYRSLPPRVQIPKLP